MGDPRFFGLQGDFSGFPAILFVMPSPSSPSLAAAPPRRRRLPFAALGLAAALALFGWGILHLFELRFSGGDVYPPYSTLRKDPLGAAAFHDALASLPGLIVERNVRPLASLALGSRLRLGQLSTPDPAASGSGPLVCFFLAADAYEWPFLFQHNEWERLDTMLQQGGRVVLTFLPTAAPLTERRLEKLRRDQSGEDADPSSDAPFYPQATPAPPGKGPARPTPPPSPRGEARPSPQPVIKRQPPVASRREDLIERWGIDFQRSGKVARDEPHADTAPSPTPAAEHDGPGLARPVAGGPWEGAGEVSWHSVLGFDPEAAGARAAGWRTLYRRGQRPVVVARKVGNKGGEIILAGDSYFLSNEALRAEPHPALLAALVGPARRVIFDETHHGIAEQPGMMTLARRYHLQGGLAALGLLAALFIWRNVVSLVPPPVSVRPAGETATMTVTGRDTGAGFLNLLRRGVSPRELIAVCLAQWQQAPGARAPDPATVERLRALAAAEAAQPLRRRSPATAYRAMCAALRVRL